MKKILLVILGFLVCAVGHTARAQVLLNVPLIIVSVPEVGMSKPFDGSALQPIGNVHAEQGRETWDWTTDEPTAWALVKGEVVIHAQHRSVEVAVDDQPEPAGCSAVPEPPTDATTWAVYNARNGEAPALVGIRYVRKDGHESWYVSEDYVYAGDGDTALIVARDPNAEHNPEWTHYIDVR